MLSIRKLGFWGIRHPRVSLDPLVLDFADTAKHGLPVLVSIRNAGGKTTQIGLALSVLRPNLHEFLGQQTIDGYHLVDYLHHGLASHVAIEWDIHGTRVVTGVVMTKTATSDEPVRTFYHFTVRPSRPGSPAQLHLNNPLRPDGASPPSPTGRPGSPNGDLDGNPVGSPDGSSAFAGLEALPVSIGRQRLSFTEFLTALRAADKAAPEAEYDETTNQTTWHRRLTRLGIDPEVTPTRSG